MFFLYFSVRMNNYEKTFMEDIKKKKNDALSYVRWTCNIISTLQCRTFSRNQHGNCSNNIPH